MTLIDYIKKYGDISFKEQEFNEIDNIIFSIIVYLNFSEILKEDINTIEKVGKQFIEKYSYSEMKELGLPQKDAYNCLKMIIGTERYKNVEISNYIYIGTDKEQFSAVTFKINKRLSYISFEGTDNLMSGWKEDFQLSYMYPTLSQIHALNYVNKTIRLFGPRIIIGGHSKGGNLALTSSMEVNIFKKFKIKHIYNNDGPGLRKKEYISKKYRKIRKKYTHIVPYNSVIGMLLRTEKHKVVKSNRKTILSHYPISWIINDNHLEETSLNIKSVELEKSIIEWLNNHSDYERQYMIDNVFNIFETCNIKDTRDLKKIKNIIKIIKELKNIDNQTKDLVISFINYNFF